MSDEHNDDYLWDPSAPADPEVARLEGLLGRYRYPREDWRAPANPARDGRRRALGPVALAALALAACVLLVWGLFGRGGGEALDGYRLLGPDGRVVHVGEELFARARATMRIGSLGEVEIEPDSRLRIDDAGDTAHRLYLSRGTVHATISAEPRVFQIGTPAGDTIDLGCEYTLTVDDAGGARVDVTDGQVAFELDGREVYVPAGASCTSTPELGPQAPLFGDADPDFAAAVAAVELAAEPDPELIARAVTIDRREDGLTLWHLFTSERAAPELRQAAYASLARLFPRPEGVTEAGLLAGDAEMRAAWVERMKWSWR